MAFSYFVILSNDFSLYKYTKFMNSEHIKLKIQQQAEHFLSALESLIRKTDATKPNDFEFDLCKTRLIELYNSVCDFQRTMPQGEFAVNEPPENNQIQEEIEQEHPEPAAETGEEPAAETTEYQQTEINPQSQEQEESSKEFIDLPEAFEITEEEQITEPEGKETTVDDYRESISHTENSAKPETISSQEQHSPKILSDKFQKDANSLHEKFNTGAEDKSISTRLKSNPIQDLRKAIGINDRFTFINELFDGNKASYDAFIDMICNAQTSSEITEILASESSRNNWADKPSRKTLNELINRYLQTK